MAERIDHKAKADKWLSNAAALYRNSGDGEDGDPLTLQAAAVAALLGIGHALRDLTGSIDAAGSRA